MQKNSVILLGTRLGKWEQGYFAREQAKGRMFPGLFPGMFPPKVLIHKGFRLAGTVGTSFSINLKIIRNIYIYHAYIRLISNIRIYIGNLVCAVPITKKWGSKTDEKSDK